MAADTLGLREAIARAARCCDACRELHRLYAVLLVNQGLGCQQVARLLDCSPRTVERWARAYETAGADGLRAARSHGRAPSLSVAQTQQLRQVLGAAPSVSGYGHPHWSGKLLSLHLARHWGLQVGPRQCQRLLKRFASSAVDLCAAAQGDTGCVVPGLAPGTRSSQGSAGRLGM